MPSTYARYMLNDMFFDYLCHFEWIVYKLTNKLVCNLSFKQHKGELVTLKHDLTRVYIENH